jgi:hypothetical protein
MKRLLGSAIAAVVFAAAGSTASADTTPVGQWHLDEGSGTVAVDSSGYGDTGTVVGGAAWATGRFGSALSFNGTTALVEIPDGPQLEPASAVTVSAWVEHAGSPGRYRYIVAKGETGCNSASYGLYTGANGGLAFYAANGTGDSYVVSPDASTSVWDGNWHLVVGTYDGTAVRVYVDGIQVGSGTPRSGPLAYPSADSNSLFIGSYPKGENIAGCQAGGFLGLIDEVTIWDHALSPTDVSGLMPGSESGTPGGSGTPPGDGPGPGKGSGPGGHKGNPPQIEHFRVRLPVRTAARKASGAVAGANITYTLTQAASLSFVVLGSDSGVMKNGRCVKAAKGVASRHRCLRLVAHARFTHAGKAGANSLRMSSVLWRKLKRGTYRLEATPSAHGTKGTTVSASFTVRH